MDQQAVEFLGRLNELLVPAVGGGVGIDFERLKAMVQAAPEGAVAAARALAADGGDGNVQVARGIAAAYAAVSAGSTSLHLQVEDILRQQRSTSVPPRLSAPGGASMPLPTTEFDRSAVGLSVGEDVLARGDPSGIVSQFTTMETLDDRRWLRNMRGKVILTFDVADPRPIQRVPRIRSFVQAFAALLPEFPYYLSPDPDDHMFVVWFAPQADIDALHGDTGLNLAHPSVTRAIVVMLRAVQKLASHLDDDPDDACRAVLGIVPPAEAAALLDAARL